MFDDLHVLFLAVVAAAILRLTNRGWQLLLAASGLQIE